MSTDQTFGASRVPSFPHDPQAIQMARSMLEVPYDAEVPLLPLLLAALDERDLVPEDFPLLGEPLPVEEQLQLVERALERGRVQCAHLLAIPIGCPREIRGGRVEWGVRRWLKNKRRCLQAEAIFSRSMRAELRNEWRD